MLFSSAQEAAPLLCPIPYPLSGMDGLYLVLCILHSWSVLSKDHGQGKEKHEQSVTHIAKHHSKEKGECDDGVGSCRQTGYSQAGPCGRLSIASLSELPQRPLRTNQERVYEAGTTWYNLEPTTINLCHPRLVF